MIGVSAKVEWLVGSEKALGDLTKSTAKNVLRRVLKKAAVPILESMEAKAPRDTGWTAGSLAISTTLNPTNKRALKREGASFAEVYVGSTRGSAAPFEEFGTIKQPPRPYLRPAYDEEKTRSLGIVKAELWVEIDKARARAARKRAKVGL